MKGFQEEESKREREQTKPGPGCLRRAWGQVPTAWARVWRTCRSGCNQDDRWSRKKRPYQLVPP